MLKDLTRQQIDAKIQSFHVTMKLKYESNMENKPKSFMYNLDVMV